jgi:hypothetical protein
LRYKNSGHHDPNKFSSLRDNAPTSTTRARHYKSDPNRNPNLLSNVNLAAPTYPSFIALKAAKTWLVASHVIFVLLPQKFLHPVDLSIQHSRILSTE